MSERPPIPTATIPFAPRKALAQDLTEQFEEVINKPSTRQKTDIENVALWVDSLRYRDLQKICLDVLGSDEEAKKLADQFALWAEKTVEAYGKDVAGRK